jgi:hypothetical protein
MSLLHVEVGLANPFQPGRQTSLKMLVDTGALRYAFPFRIPCVGELWVQ